MLKAMVFMKKLLPKPLKTLLSAIYKQFRNRPFEPYIKKKNIEGVKFDFWICDREGRDWYDLQCTDPEWAEMRFIKDHLIREGDIVFECGGHHGCTAIVLSKWVGEFGKVVTFEPLPANADIIEKNIQHNEIKNLILERKAVGADLGRIFINNNSNSSIDMAGNGIEVDLTYLDKFIHMKPTVLKIDVEGYEMEVLKGAKNILSTRPRLVIEIHTDSLSRYGTSIESLFQVLDVTKYKMWIQWEDGKQPEVYKMQSPILKRVHFFGIPLEDYLN